MTALRVASDDRFASIPNEKVNEALSGWEDPEALFAMRQTRDGEELQGIAVSAQVRALYCSDWFWGFCEQVFPHNDLFADDQRGSGAPQHFPDWFLFLLVCSAGIAGNASIKSAVDHISDERTWKDFVADVDAYVPENMTRLRDLPCRKPDSERQPMAKPGTEKNERTKARQRNLSVVVPLRPRPHADAPNRHHLDHFKLRWRGIEKKYKYRGPIPVGHPDYGMRDKAFHAFRRLGIDQAHAMNILHPEAVWAFRRPDRNSFVGGDGVVFPFSRKHLLGSAAEHVTGEKRQVYGSKFTILSARINGQYLSRLILDLRHTHEDHIGSAKDESTAVLDSLPELCDLAKGGIRGLLFDSAIRGNAVTKLQRDGVHVINYPHAASNPDGGAGKRLNPSRKEKSKLRHVHVHTDQFGLQCEHPIYAVGGELIELVTKADGEDAPRLLVPDGYERRGAPGKRRDYLLVTLDCQREKVKVRVPLFHTDGPSTSPGNTNWGEVSRVYSPGSPQFKYLYGARNDTEARHADLKARVKYLPRDVLGQELRLLASSVAINAAAWQVHLQAHGEPNVIDDTA